MKLRILTPVFLVGIIAYAGMPAAKKDPFSPARDFPRDALVYAQFSDLPGLINAWNESDVRTKYLESQNLSELKKRHLGLKLASRWQEFNEAAGFPFDLAALTGFADRNASIAIYDIGRLEFVFIASVSDEAFAATKLMENSSRFTEEELGKGLTAYRVSVAADRGRQKQEILFTNIKGRLIVATSEKLLARTIANINGASRKDSLSDEPGFSSLSVRIIPHVAAVWVDQAALNDDYYFKHYWLMGDPGRLKNIRAGMFDFAVEDGKVIERREFLLKAPENLASVTSPDTAALLSNVPADVPFYRLAAADSKTVNDAIRTVLALSDKHDETARSSRRSVNVLPTDGPEYDPGEYGFGYLGDEFEEKIDDAGDSDEAENKKDHDPLRDLSKLLSSARPVAILTLEKPEVLPAPLFATFHNVAVFRLSNPAGFDGPLFESTLKESLQKNLMVIAPDRTFGWETRNENGISWHTLELPMLDWNICYTVQGSKLFLANDPQFLQGVVSSANAERVEKISGPINALTVLDIKQNRDRFDLLFGKLAGNDASDDLFTGNIASLLSSSPETRRIEITRKYSGTFLNEELTISAE